ncbi:hypothetical protein COO60DRAFT_791784 [Scenedesmus sp. NREL 46B-D3]|nr:hypothetical protein COO60DRAFT_791784 [Scenedesmus sp. NREL 46B-D3]
MVCDASLPAVHTDTISMHAVLQHYEAGNLGCDAVNTVGSAGLSPWHPQTCGLMCGLQRIAHDEPSAKTKRGIMQPLLIAAQPLLNACGCACHHDTPQQSIGSAHQGPTSRNPASNHQFYSQTQDTCPSVWAMPQEDAKDCTCCCNRVLCWKQPGLQNHRLQYGPSCIRMGQLACDVDPRPDNAGRHPTAAAPVNVWAQPQVLECTG